MACKRTRSSRGPRVPPAPKYRVKPAPRGVDPITGEKTQRGRPKSPPPDERLRIEKAQRRVDRIRELAGLGVPVASIAVLVGISLERLQKHHEEDMALGRAQAIERVLQALLERVTEGGQKNTIETLFWCKCNAGWAETAAGRAAVEKQEKSEDDTRMVTFEFADRSGAGTGRGGSKAGG